MGEANSTMAVWKGTPLGPIGHGAYSVARLQGGEEGNLYQKMHTGAVKAQPAPDPVLSKLQELAALPYGWEYGEGRPTLPHIYETARTCYRALAPYQFKADAFPCADGSLYLVFYKGLLSVELCFWADGTIDLNVEKDSDDAVEELESQENISLAYAMHQVIQVLVQERSQWDSSDSFILGTMTVTEVDFAARAFRTQATEPEYRLLTRTAYPAQQLHSAGILPDTT